MKAAVVTSFDAPPAYAEFAPPEPASDEVLVTVTAAALSQLVRAQAAGKFYGGSTPPFVPGADGVGLLAGKRVYFAFPRAPVGSMAEQVAVKRAYCVPLADELDDVTAAAAANPGMASWAALTLRAGFKPGQNVLINGATGASGRLAIQIAKHLGASRVVATGRNAAHEAELRALGADHFIALEQAPEALTAAFRGELAGAGVDVVLDFLFGSSAETFIAATLGRARGIAEPRIAFVQIGAVAGPTITLPGAALRSSGLELIGTGLGAASNQELVGCVAEVLRAYPAAGFRVAAQALPLSSVASAWQAKSTARIVLTP